MLLLLDPCNFDVRCCDIVGRKVFGHALCSGRCCVRARALFLSFSLNADSCAYLTWCFERDGSSEWCVIGTESLLTTNGTQGVERIGCCTENALKRGDGAVEYNVAFSFSSFFKIWRETSRGFEPRSLDSESRVLTVTPRGRLPQKTSGSDCSLWKYTLGLVPLEEGEHFEREP